MTMKRFRVPLGVLLSLAAGVALAADPSAHQIYLATRAGNIAQAEQMVAQVLKDHPRSAKAHFVAAEVEARAGNFGNARSQLAQAQALAPGLPFASAQAVRALQRELGLAPTRTESARHGAHFGLGWPLLLIGGVLVLWMIVRRRMAAAAYSSAYPGQFPGGMAPGAGPMGPPGGYPPGAYPPGYPQGGSGIMGNIASGLAVGAGVAAGEALVGRMLEGNGGNSGIADAGAAQIDPQANADLGGNDFGLNDPGSWDDGGAGGGGWDSGGGGDGGWT